MTEPAQAVYLSQNHTMAVRLLAHSSLRTRRVLDKAVPWAWKRGDMRGVSTEQLALLQDFLIRWTFADLMTWIERFLVLSRQVALHSWNGCFWKAQVLSKVEVQPLPNTSNCKMMHNFPNIVLTKMVSLSILTELLVQGPYLSYMYWKVPSENTFHACWCCYFMITKYLLTRSKIHFLCDEVSLQLPLQLCLLEHTFSAVGLPGWSFLSTKLL